MRRGENIFIICTFLFGAIIILGSLNTSYYDIEPLMPGLYGIIVGGLIMACCAVKLAQNYLKNKASPGDDKPLVIGYPLIVLFQAVMTVLFVVGMTTLGFFITTFFYLVLSICLLAQARKLKSILIYIAGSGAFCVVLYMIFNVFHIFLPKAIFI